MQEIREGLRQPCRSPSWGAWIEMVSSSLTALVYLVAPPRGERGLKFDMLKARQMGVKVAPPRGERGLK